MKYNRYEIKDVNIGDEVYFDSTPVQSNHDLYWKILDKLEKQNQLIVQLNDGGFKDLRWTIDIAEVRQYITIPNK